MTKPIITGPGEYRTRDGRKALIEEYVGSIHAGDKLVWRGRLVKGNYTWHWSNEGMLFPDDSQDPHDIIGPWVEPASAPLTITVTEVRAYRATDGAHEATGATRAEAVQALLRMLEDEG